MNLTEIVSDSKEYLRVPVYASKAGVSYDPTSKVVTFAFDDAADAEHHGSLSWHSGVWDTVAGVHYAQCLVNDSWVPTAGVYAVYVKVTDSPEIPIKYAGLLKVT